MKTKQTKLLLANGDVFYGVSPIHQKSLNYGEVVFTTGMTGYVETLTDPSYAEQIITFTFPLIGNYGVPDASTWESKKIHAAGVILNDAMLHFSHHDAQMSLFQWLESQNIPVMFGVDTRAVTLKIRKTGVIPGVIADIDETPSHFIDPNLEDLVAKVSISSPTTHGSGKKTIIAVDCGMKENIMRHLSQFPIIVKRVPFDYDYSNEDYDGVFISNGPGDPANCIKTIEVLQKALKTKKPIFGICLGAQLLALAIGAKTYKLRFGHRALNQPVMFLETKRCYLTSQNHGYAIDESTLPSDWVVSFKHLNDQSVQGIAHKTLPYFAVQFHPEANPGPMDTTWLFDQFYKVL